MGMVFGKVDVAEPTFDVLLSRTGVDTPYDIRKYGKRFAIETEYTPNVDGNKGEDGTSSPFFALAGYIGVMGEAQNEGSKKIAMTAPVVMENAETSSTTGEKIAMTAPVIMSNKNEKEKKEDVSGVGEKIAMTAPVTMANKETTDGGKHTKTMQFILPAEYDSMDKIPKPTNPAVHVKEIEPAVGVVHRFSGFFSEKIHQDKAKDLAKQLNKDGLDISEESMLNDYQFWGYNPPYTIPFLRRNEVWYELKEEDAQKLISQYSPSSADEDKAGVSEK